jgi:phenylpyruvate tautomerase PptA (4-oxalocrotonate tautomerase family)
MPFVRITVLSPTLEAEQIGRLQRETKDLMMSVMRKPLAGVAVLVERITAGSWTIADGEVTTAAYVEAVIGRGTNSAAEKASFMADMMKLLRTVLGPNLDDESYVVIHEIDRESYGRGGISRAERDHRQARSSNADR